MYYTYFCMVEWKRQETGIINSAQVLVSTRLLTDL